jgi:tetratricopeptide (TPR) repeat protein
VVAAARAWWDAQGGKRRFLWVHLYDPHAAYDPPEPFASRYRDNPYLGEVAAADSFLAPLLAPLLDGRQPPALVIVTSDHGESLGEHGEQTHGLFAYEATLKVPLVVWGPGIAPGRDGRPARHVDIVPTVLSFLRLGLPAGLPGRSLLAPAGAGGSYFEALSTALNRGWAPLRGRLDRGKKLIDLPLPELYDLSTDPREERNRYADDRRTAHALREALPRESAWPPPRGAVSPEEEARLRSLGYATGSGSPTKTAYTAADDPKTLVGVDNRIHQVIDAYSRRRYAEAAALARQVIAERPDLPEAYEDLALALQQLERPDEAIAALRGALAHGAGRASIRRQLGLALAEAGRAGEAVAVLQPLAAPGTDPDAATLNALGIALSDAGRHGEAVAVLQRAAERYPNDPKGFENLGVVALRMDQPEAARAQLQRALALNPALPISWNTLGVALYRLEGPAAALDAWQRSVALDPRQYDALFNIGLVAAQAGRAAEARQALARFVATAPPSRFGPDLQKARQLLARLSP